MSRPRLSEKEPKCFVFETSWYVFGERIRRFAKVNVNKVKFYCIVLIIVANCSVSSNKRAYFQVSARCIDVSRYLSRDSYRDTLCKNRDTRDLATFLRFLFECSTDINCQSAKNYQCGMSSHRQQTNRWLVQSAKKYQIMSQQMEL